MLTLSGPADGHWRGVIDWATANVNQAGGIDGRPLQVDYVDLARETDVAAVAERLARDASVAAVIGPDTSTALYEAAPVFLRHQKVLISPSATSGDIFRAFSGKKLIWRTVESDIAQMQTMLVIAARDGAHKVALLAPTDHYGSTFLDWFGFYATELGLEVTSIERYDQAANPDCGTHLDHALQDEPDVLFAIPADPTVAGCLARQLRTRAARPRVLFSDTANYPSIPTDLGMVAEGLEGTIVAPDPAHGFEKAYLQALGHAPPPFAANAYDAVALVAFGLERSGSRGGERLADAITEVVDARGPETGWHLEGMTRALAAIRAGDLPNIDGASGPLDYDANYHTDVSASTYAHWRVQNGQYVYLEHLSSAGGPRVTSTSSIYRSFASEALQQKITYVGGDQVESRKGVQAVIVATSLGWKHARHQNDALAAYQLLKSQGVADEDIILIIEDDLAYSSSNPDPGVVRNVPGGPNLYQRVTRDYRLSELTTEDFWSVLAGKASARLPHAVACDPGRDLYLFVVGHGNAGGVSWMGMGTDVSRTLHPERLGSVISTLHESSCYRRMLVTVEACQGGVMGEHLHSPGVMLMAGANSVESSFGANYDPALKSWLADQFSFELTSLASQQPSISLHDLYKSLYLRVGGSHVTLYNGPWFGDLKAITLHDFTAP